jgi:hypothetical protein
MDLASEVDESFSECLSDKFRETIFDSSHFHSWEISGLGSITLDGWTICEEVSDELRWSMIVRSSEDKCSLFPISLELHSSKRMIRSKILRRHGDHEG